MLGSGSAPARESERRAGREHARVRYDCGCALRAYAAPVRPIVEIDPGIEEGLVPPLDRYAVIAAERVAGRRAHELKAILDEVLLEMQDEGKVMVTLERLQPVFHMTVASEF